MNSKLKLLALVFVIIIVCLAAISTIQTVGNGKSQASLIRVACIGDSLTADTEYTVDLWSLLGPNYTVGNLGIAGAAVCQTSDSPYLNETALQVAKQFEPNIVIIMLGTNDAHTDLNESNAAFVSDYIKLITEFQTLNSKPKLWLVEPPPIFNSTIGLSEELLANTVIPNIKQVANETNLPLIDAFSPFLNHPQYFIDGVHPNVKGAHLIANVTYSAISSNSK